MARDRQNGKFRGRRGEVLFIDARKLGHILDRPHRELNGEDIACLSDADHVWRSKDSANDYSDTPGFGQSASLKEIRRHGHALTPGCYVGADLTEDNDELLFDFMLPLLADQRRIAQILGALDNKIKLNRRMNEILE